LEAFFFELVVSIKMFAFDQFAIGPNQFVVGKLRIGEKNET
jgi:hypothetical protein